MAPPLSNRIRGSSLLNPGISSLGSNSSNDYRTALQRTFMVLTALPITLALIAFILNMSEDFDKHLMEEDVRFPGWKGKSEKSRVGLGNKMSLRSTISFPHEPGFRNSLKPSKGPKIALMTTTAAGLDQVLPWILYHKVIGVSSFYLFVEGRAASENSTSVLSTIPGVHLILRTKKLEMIQSRSRIWNESWLSAFFYRPCNYELFVRQALNMEYAISLASESQHDWISHVDTDELLYPSGSPEFSLQSLFLQVDEDIDNVIFPNYESIVERDDVEDRFLDVTIFKKNPSHIPWQVYSKTHKEATRGNPNYFLTYGNGKSAARIRPGLRGNGAHRFHNYLKKPKEHTFKEAAILHYTYSKFSDLTSRRNRCNCKPTKEDVKRCFILDFDRQAYIIAATQTEDEMKAWYIEHVVWANPEVNQKFISSGIFGRIYTPQIIIKGLMTSGVMDAAISQGMISRRKDGIPVKTKIKSVDKDEDEEEEESDNKENEVKTQIITIKFNTTNLDGEANTANNTLDSQVGKEQIKEDVSSKKSSDSTTKSASNANLQTNSVDKNTEKFHLRANSNEVQKEQVNIKRRLLEVAMPPLPAPLPF